MLTLFHTFFTLSRMIDIVFMCLTLTWSLFEWGGGGGGNKKNHKKALKKAAILSKMKIVDVFVIPGYVFFGSFSKWIFAEGRSTRSPWCKERSNDKSGCPMTNLEVFGDEASLQYFQKTLKSTSHMSCKTKPGQSSRQCLRMVRPLLPDTPRPSQFQPEL